MEADDGEAYRSEVLGEFRARLSTLFDADALDAVVAEGVRDVAPERDRDGRAGMHAPGAGWCCNRRDTCGSAVAAHGKEENRQDR